VSAVTVSPKFQVVILQKIRKSMLIVTGMTYEAMIWSQDSDFQNLADVKYIEK